jgi:hypothetical protein
MILIYFKETGEISKVVNNENGQELPFSCMTEIEE